ncbi:MAG: methylated-DNA--[protein]-cysteine S-methyltransferase [Solirubrobacteraceae bacterium]
MNVSTDTIAPPARAAWTVHESPIGSLTLVTGPAGLRRLAFAGQDRPLNEHDRDPAALADVTAQLDEYFAGARRRFELELDLAGTEFQLAVWRALLAIPYGETVSYGHVARTIGRLEHVRAVGAANGRNPIAIIVPCHRVIGADGSLTGYAGGLERKRTLLNLEAGVAGGQPALFSPISGR